MIDWLILAAYLAGFVWAYRKAYVLMDEDMELEDAFDKCMAASGSVVVGLFWPPVLAVYVIYRTITPTTPRMREQQLRGREDRVREYERDVARLERECGIHE